jgi:anti-sigma factor RsiW
VNCESVARCLDAVVDGEVDPSARISIERHLDDCGACRERLEFARAFQARLQDALRPGRAPEALRERVQTRLSEERGVFSLHRLDASWRATAIAAAVALGVFSLGRSLDSRGESLQASVAPILEDVIRSHARPYPAEVATTEQVPAYFENKVGFAVRPVDFADPTVRFVGARSTQVGGRSAATLEYEASGQRRMTVVAFRLPAFVSEIGEPLEGVQAQGVRFVRVNGHVVPLVEHEGVLYAVVGDMGPEDHLAFATRAALR